MRYPEHGSLTNVKLFPAARRYSARTTFAVAIT